MDLIFRINDFFDDYADALLSFNAKRLAYYYDLPCSLLSPASHAALTDAAQLEGFLAQGQSFYKQNGIAVLVADVRSKQPLATGLVKVRLQWHYYNSSGDLLYHCTYYYIVREDPSGSPKIAVAISVDEKEQVEAWLSTRDGNTAPGAL